MDPWFGETSEFSIGLDYLLDYANLVDDNSGKVEGGFRKSCSKDLHRYDVVVGYDGHIPRIGAETREEQTPINCSKAFCVFSSLTLHLSLLKV